MKALKIACVALALLAGTTAGAVAQNLIKVKTAWTAGLELFPVWYGLNRNWDADEGLDVEFKVYPTSAAEIQALPTGAWNIASMGISGILVGGMRHDIRIIGAPMADSDGSNAIYARSDSPIFTAKGINPDYPDVFGSAKTVKGRTILVTTGTSNHFLVGRWLTAVGLMPQDVKLVTMDNSAMVGTMDKKTADAMSASSPFTAAAEAHGYRRVATSLSLNARQMSQLIADRAWLDANEAAAVKYLRFQYRANQFVRDHLTDPAVLAEAARFYREVLADTKLTPQEIAAGLAERPPMLLQDALKLMSSQDGEQDKISAWNSQAAVFFTSAGIHTQADLLKFIHAPLVTAIYLAQAAETPLRQ